MPTTTTLDLSEILSDVQGNILRGYRSNAAAYVFLSVHDAAEAKAWLADLAAQVTTANVKPPQRTLNLAVTYPGLRALGLPPRSLASFPEAFRDGMAKRSALLGDAGDNAPGRWHAPFREKDDLHLMVLIAGQDADSVSQRVEELQQGLWQAGLHEVAPPLNAHRLDDDHEHFGYKDGMSQPGVLGVHEEGGVGEGALQDGRWRPLQPGEFLLGLPDEDGGPPVLPDPPELGQGGSYLVLRKLQQDVAEFRRLLSATARRLGVSDDTVAAKLMGRWRDGTPLTLRPEGPDPALAGDKRANNRFTFTSDTDGFRCPVGAHIRRANPRGSLGFGGLLERRHRIIRRGMPYGPPLPEGAEDDHRDRGLVFACYQADIERQFEFIQAHWLGDGNAFALGTDRDPLIGDPGDGSRRLRIEGQPPRFVDALQQTVRVRGGAYFLVPGISALCYLSRLPAPGAAPAAVS
jgi:Dyp-type peroxidase family